MIKQLMFDDECIFLISIGKPLIVGFQKLVFYLSFFGGIIVTEF